MSGERRDRKARDVSEGGATERHRDVSPAVVPTTKNGRPEDRPPTHMPTAPRASRNLWIHPLRIDRLPGKCDIPDNINGAQELMPYSQLNEKQAAPLPPRTCAGSSVCLSRDSCGACAAQHGLYLPWPTTWRRDSQRQVRGPENPAPHCTLASPPASAAHRAAPSVAYDFTRK